MRDELLTQAKRIVVKIGSSLLASRESGLQLDRIEQLAADLAGLRLAGREVVLVSSGAILSGMSKLGVATYPKSLPLKQAAAAVGQSRLMWAYEKAFERLGLKVAQILLTHQDLADRRRFLNARHTLTALLDFGVIPIVNENDTVSVEEIRFGDNDTLAGQVAHLVDADLLIILSDVDGVFTEDPRKHPGARLIPLIAEVNADIERRAGGASRGTGGMATKIQAAKKVAAYGVATLIMNGETPGLLPGIFEGREAGTLILPGGRRLPSRKHWIAHTLRPKGQLTLDEGAVEALTTRGKSLLPSGIVAVTGDFDPGDAVTCLDPNGKEFAKGLVNFSSSRLMQIKGLKTADIKKLLGDQEYDEAIHRDNLVLLSA
ncbi:glutamate 5-kinase [Candidatus Nitrospira bockiana]